jgi:hypothetical protein
MLASRLLSNSFKRDGSCRPGTCTRHGRALALDRRLDGAEFVDAFLDNLDRLLDG